MVETLSMAIFGSLTLLFAAGMTAALLWAAARDGEMDRRANRSVEPIPAPDTTLRIGAQWAPSFED